MRKTIISAGALALGIAFASAPAFAQQGPAGANYGAGSGPQTGGTPYQSTSSQAGAKTSGRPLYNAVPHSETQAGNQTMGPAGPGGANYGAGSGPQTGR